jgi:gas vesicle protein
MSRNSDTALAFLLGAVTGGIVALLLAPEKGEVTRGKLKRGASDIYTRGRGWVDGTQRDLLEKAEDLSERVKGKAQDVGESARHQLGAVKEAVSEGKEAYRREMEKS